MRTMKLFALGMLSVLVATAGFVSTGLAAHPETERVDVIDAEDLPKEVAEKVEQPDSRYAEDPVAKAMSDDNELTRVDVKDTDMELEGPAHNYKKPLNR